MSHVFTVEVIVAVVELHPCRVVAGPFEVATGEEGTGHIEAEQTATEEGTVEVAMGRTYLPLVSEWLKTKYCNRKGEQAQLIH